MYQEPNELPWIGCLTGLVDGWKHGETCRNGENQVLWEFSDSESWSIHEDEVTGKPVAYKKGAEKPAASSVSVKSGNPTAERRKWQDNFYISSAVVSYMNEVYSIVRKTYVRGPTDEIGGPQRERGHLENAYDHTSSSSSSCSWLRSDFTICQESFLEFFDEIIQRNWKIDQEPDTEINGVSTTDCEEYTRSATSLLRDRIFQISNAKTYVYVDSVLCLEGYERELERGLAGENWVVLRE